MLPTVCSQWQERFEDDQSYALAAYCRQRASVVDREQELPPRMVAPAMSWPLRLLSHWQGWGW